MFGNCLVAAQLAAPQEGFSYIELVGGRKLYRFDDVSVVKQFSKSSCALHLTAFH
jgi:hypothetical protein